MTFPTEKEHRCRGCSPAVDGQDSMRYQKELENSEQRQHDVSTNVIMKKKYGRRSDEKSVILMVSYIPTVHIVDSTNLFSMT